MSTILRVGMTKEERNRVHRLGYYHRNKRIQEKNTEERKRKRKDRNRRYYVNKKSRSLETKQIITNPITVEEKTKTLYHGDEQSEGNIDKNFHYDTEHEEEDE